MHGRTKKERTALSTRQTKVARQIAADFLASGDSIETLRIFVGCGAALNGQTVISGASCGAIYNFTPAEWQEWSASRKRKDKSPWDGAPALVGRHLGYKVTDCAGRNAVTAGFTYVRCSIMVEHADERRERRIHRREQVLPKMVDAILAFIEEGAK